MKIIKIPRSHVLANAWALVLPILLFASDASATSELPPVSVIGDGRWDRCSASGGAPVGDGRGNYVGCYRGHFGEHRGGHTFGGRGGAGGGSRLNTFLHNTGSTDGSSDTSPGVGSDDASTDSECRGNPIILATGNKIEPVKDFAVAEEAGLTLARTYNHHWQGIGLFGKHWISSFDYMLTYGTTSINSCYPKPGGRTCSIGSNTVIYAWRPDGRTIKFIKKSDGVFYEDKPSPVAKIISTKSGMTLYNEGNSVEQYGTGGRILRLRDAHGIGWDYAYNGNYPVRVTHTSGRQVQFTWTDGQLIEVRDSAGNPYRFSYHADKFGSGLHRLASVSKPGAPATKITYHYELAAQPSALTGKSINGDRYSTFTYDSRGYATSSEHNGREKFQFTYTPASDGRLTVVETNPLGRKTTYQFKDGKPVSTSGHASTYCPAMAALTEYDSNGHPVMRSNFRGNETAFVYNAKGQLTKKIEAYGHSYARRTAYEWDVAKNRITSVTVGLASGANLLRTEYSYTPTGRIARVVQINLSQVGRSEPLITTYGYTTHPDGMLHTRSVDGPLPGSGDKVTYTYGASRFLTSITNGLGHTVAYADYNELGQPGRITGPNGSVKKLYYDARGRVIRATTFIGGDEQAVEYVYDAQGRLSKTVTPDGVTTQIGYGVSPLRWNIGVTDRALAVSRMPTTPEQLQSGRRWLGDEVIYTSDVAGNLIVTEVARHTEVLRSRSCDPFMPCLPDFLDHQKTVTRTLFTDYDELNRPRAVRGNNGQNLRYTYTNHGGVNSVTDSLGRKTTFYIDRLDRVHVSTGPLGGKTTFHHDALDRITKVIDPLGGRTSYVYDGFGNLWKLISPDTGTTTFSYDQYGRRTKMVRAGGAVTTFEYDAAGRLVLKRAGNHEQRFLYDLCSNGRGRLCAVSSPRGRIEYTYTPAGLLKSKRQRIGEMAGLDQFYTYDAIGRLIKVTYPGGVAVEYGYEYDRAATLTVKIDGIAHSLATDIQYGVTGGFRSWRYGNGLFRHIRRDQDGRVTALQVGERLSRNPDTVSLAPPIQDLTYAYSSNDLIIKINNNNYAASTQSYSYDALSRLSTNKIGGGRYHWSYSYDANGNRTRADLAGVVDGVYNYTTAIGSNRLQATSGRASVNYHYDAKGNLIDADGVTYSYDPFNRLSSVFKDGARTDYWVNALGQRTRKFSGAQKSTIFVHGLGGQIAAERKDVGGAHTWTHYIRLGGEVVGVVRNGQLFFVHNDHLGRPEIVTNGVQAIVWRADNFAFSRNVRLDSIGGLNIGFPGQYYDAETGLWHNGFRDYNQAIGRYIQSDPIGLAGGLNTYAYVGGNPVNYIDPLGLYCLTAQQINAIAGAAGGFVGGAIAGRRNARLAIAMGAVGLVVGGGYGYASDGASGGQGALFAGMSAAAFEMSPMSPGGLGMVALTGAFGQALADEMGGGPLANLSGAAVGGGGGSAMATFMGAAERVTLSMVRRSIASGAAAGMAAAGSQEAVKAYLEKNNDCPC